MTFFIKTVTNYLCSSYLKKDWELIIIKINNLLKNNEHIPELVLRAVIAGEDKRFLDHNGVDWIAIFRCIFNFFIIKKLYGASTIEQQLVRTIRVRYERTLSRKLSEMVLAIKLSLIVNKRDILSTYIGVAYYGAYMNSYRQVLKRKNWDNSYINIERACEIAAMLKYPLPQVPSDEILEMIQRRKKYIMEKQVPFLTKWERILQKHYPSPKKWKRYIISDKEIKMFINTWIFHNMPYAIQNHPSVFGNALNYLSSVLKVDIRDIYITGSAQFGYSLHPKQFGKRFKKKKSDLDMFIISSRLFQELHNDMISLKTVLLNKTYTNIEQKKEIERCLKNVEKNYERGFFDYTNFPWQEEYIDYCPNSIYINKRVYNFSKIINEYKKNKINFGFKKITLRIYESYNSAKKQIFINIRDSFKYQRNNEKP